MSQYPPPPTSHQQQYAFYNTNDAASHGPSKHSTPQPDGNTENNAPLLDDQMLKVEDGTGVGAPTAQMSPYQTTIDAATAADAYTRAESNLQALAHHNSQVAAAAAVAAAENAGSSERISEQPQPPQNQNMASGGTSGPNEGSVSTVSMHSHHNGHAHPHHHAHHHPHHPAHDNEHATAASAVAALSAVNSPHLGPPPPADYSQLAPLAHMGVPPENGHPHPSHHPHHPHPNGTGLEISAPTSSAAVTPVSAITGNTGLLEASSPSTPRQRANRLKKACDSCSIRKVKCDESGPPCRACSILEIPCTFNRPSKRRGPPNKHAEAIKRQRREEEAYMAAAAAAASGVPPPGLDVTSSAPVESNGSVQGTPHGRQSVLTPQTPSAANMATMGHSTSPSGSAMSFSTPGMASVNMYMTGVSPIQTVTPVFLPSAQMTAPQPVVVPKRARPDEEVPPPVLRSHMA